MDKPQHGETGTSGREGTLAREHQNKVCIGGLGMTTSCCGSKAQPVYSTGCHALWRPDFTGRISGCGPGRFSGCISGHTQTFRMPDSLNCKKVDNSDNLQYLCKP